MKILQKRNNFSKHRKLNIPGNSDSPKNKTPKVKTEFFSGKKIQKINKLSKYQTEKVKTEFSGKTRKINKSTKELKIKISEV